MLVGCKFIFFTKICMYSYDSNGNEPKCHFGLLERVEENESFIDKHVRKGTSEYV